MLSNNECQCAVDSGFYLQSTSNPLFPLCLPCHNFCSTCTGPTNTECSSCVGLPNLASLSGTTCDCVENYYAVFNQITQAYECQTCHPLCAECFGVLPSQCTNCLPGMTYNYPTTCSCPTGTYYNTNSNTCTKCNTLCSNCFGSQSNQCTSCSSSAFGIQDNPSLCVSQCPDGYFTSSGICLSKNNKLLIRM